MPDASGAAASSAAGGLCVPRFRLAAPNQLGKWFDVRLDPPGVIRSPLKRHD